MSGQEHLQTPAAATDLTARFFTGLADPTLCWPFSSSATTSYPVSHGYIKRPGQVHVGVTRHPTDGWVAQQLREATAEEQRPRHLLCDRDSKYGAAFIRMAAVSGIDLVRTAYRAPRMNAIVERFLGSVRRECLDHLLILGEGHLRRVLRAYVRYFNGERPHQGLKQQVPEPVITPGSPAARTGPVRATAILGGLHHAYYYYRAA